MLRYGYVYFLRWLSYGFSCVILFPLVLFNDSLCICSSQVDPPRAMHHFSLYPAKLRGYAHGGCGLKEE